MTQRRAQEPRMPPNKTNFETERTRKFRASALPKEDERTISHIEEFGCSVVCAKKTNYSLGWSYTNRRFRSPTVMISGLPLVSCPSGVRSSIWSFARILKSKPSGIAGTITQPRPDISNLSSTLKKCFIASVIAA